ncbi:DNA-binding protein [Desulfovulcanus sp.]
MEYTIQELATAIGKNRSTVLRRAKKESWPFSKRKGRGGGKLYPFSSLPSDIQQAILEHQAKVDSAEDDIRKYLESRKIFLEPKDMNNPKIIRKIKAAQAVESVPPYQGKTRIIKVLAKKYGVSPITIRRWVQDVEAMRLRRPRITLEAGLEPVELPRARAWDEQALAYACAVYARNLGSGKKAAYKAMQKEAHAKGWRFGDYTSFTRLLKKIPNAIWERLQKGDIGFELQHVPKIIRSWLSVPVQTVICGDQKIFDYKCFDPATNEFIITNGYLWMDCSSRFINGFWIELGPYNSNTVGYSLREAVSYGLPEEVFTDWGKPEGSKHVAHILRGLGNFGCMTGDFAEMYSKYGNLDHRKAQPGKPWLKPIENIMNLVDRLLKDRFTPGYRKRDNDAWKNKEIQKRLKQQKVKGEILTVEEFIEEAFKVIEEHNNRQKKLKEGKNIIPAQVFFEGLKKSNRPVLHEHTLDYICLPTVRRKPRQSAVHVKFRKDDFRTFYSPKLSAYSDYVYVSIDPYDRKAPAVLTDLDGNFLDLAEPWLVQDPYDDASLSQKRERQAELMKWVRKQCRQLKDGYGMVEKPSVVQITCDSKTAQAVAKAKEKYEQSKKEQKKQARVIQLQADKAREELRKEFERQQGSEKQGFTVPDDIREKYKLWKSLDARRAKHEYLSIEEENFWRYFQNTADFRAYKAMEEDFADVMFG